MATLKRLVVKFGSRSPVSSAVRFYRSDESYFTERDKFNSYLSRTSARAKQADEDLMNAFKELCREMFMKDVRMLVVPMAVITFSMVYLDGCHREGQAKRAARKSNEELRRRS